MRNSLIVPWREADRTEFEDGYRQGVLDQRTGRVHYGGSERLIDGHYDYSQPVDSPLQTLLDAYASEGWEAIQVIIHPSGFGKYVVDNGWVLFRKR